MASVQASRPWVIGCDFSSSPSRQKPIVLARGQLDPVQRCVQLEAFECFASLDDWAAFLHKAQAWVGGFDLPFGLPRELVETLGWPLDWHACMAHYAALPRTQIREQFKAFCDSRPAGRKFAHRQTDGPAGSSPSMKWVNPPVAYMLHAGVPRLLAAGVDMPGLHCCGSPRVALEAYPGLLAREILACQSYKSDDKKRQTPEREAARKHCLDALLLGRNSLQMVLQASPVLQSRMVGDATGDHLDAAICMLQAAWGLCQHAMGHACYGLPPGMDPLEGWIITARASGEDS